jgi:hypothetical protein
MSIDTARAPHHDTDAAAPLRREMPWWLPPLAAAGAAVLGWLLGWRGVDLPAQVYRIGLFHRSGLTLWDNEWYGGHWTFDYSVLFPAIAGVLGLTVTALLSATGAALAFDRVAVDHFGPVGRVGSLLFAVGTTVQLAIGQLPFLTGEAFALGACWAATRRRWPLAIALSFAATLSSPLAGAFLALGLVAWLVARWPKRRTALLLMLAGVALPVVITTILFPGQGTFPYPAGDFAVDLAVAVIFWAIVPGHERVLRMGAACYGLATVACFVIPSPLGGNIGRMAECLAIPLGACILWPRRKVLLAVLAIPVALMQWSPAFGAMTGVGHDPSTQQSYYQPLVAELQDYAEPLGRVEVVPTRYHWEAAYVAPAVPLARGWERQLDIADNPLFYDADTFNAASYRAWLIDNGVRSVALSDAPLDFAGVAEAQLVKAGVPGLVLTWTNTHWRVYSVVGSSGIVDGPARLTGLDAGRVGLVATAAGSVLLRVHYNPNWRVTSGTACVYPSSDNWTMLQVPGPEAVTLQLRLFTDPDQPSGCP